MSADQPNSSDSPAIARQASTWLARLDRGLTPAEQDEYLQWLREDPRHAAELARHEVPLRRMMQLADWQPIQSSEPNPDLFAPSKPQRWRSPWVRWSLAAAAAVTIGIGVWWQGTPSPAPQLAATKSYLRVNERQALPDGSIVELKDGSRITPYFTANERRVRLSGEAHFTVAKNPARPFVVDASGVEVRAVGTAFNVRLAENTVEVLVTEGKVRLEQTAASLPENPRPAETAPLVVSGQRAIIELGADTPTPQIATLTPKEIEETLSWQAARLQFYETPLAEAVAEFNRHNRQQLVIGEPSLNAVPIGGTFRPDNIEGFVRLLEFTVNIRAERRDNGQIVLLRARQ